METAFTFLGCRFEVLGDDPAMHRVVANFWAVPELADAPIDTPTTIAIRHAGSLPEGFSTAYRNGPVDERRLVTITLGERAVVIGPALAAEISRGQAGFVVDVFGDLSTEPLPVHVAISEGLAAGGFLPLHAGVVTRSGRTIAICGPSGAGKTTTSVLAVLEGARFVAEDSSWLHPGTMKVYGADAQLRLRSGAESILGERLRRDLGIDLGGLEHDGLKRLVPYELLGGRDRFARLDELIVLGPRDRPEVAGALRPAEVAMALHQAAGIPLLASVRAARAATIERIVAKLPARRISSPSGHSGL